MKILSGLIAILLASSSMAQIQPYLFKDINPGTAHSDVGWFCKVGNTLFFYANDGAHGLELWKTDGTISGTVMVKDINLGASGSVPRYLTEVNGTLFFSANDGVHGIELWKSDGTDAGTVMVKDINPGMDDSEPIYMINVNGTLFFSADDNVHGQELWKSDGTEVATIMVKDINVSSGATNDSRPSYLTNVNGVLFFQAKSNLLSAGLWKSDGTDVGTVMVSNVSPSSELLNVNGTLFFDADEINTNNPGNYELWKSDGTTVGTVLVKDTVPANPVSLFNMNGVLFFYAGTPTNSLELWKSDGTAAGTMMVKDINPGIGYSFPVGLLSGTYVFGKVSNTLFFAANDGVNGNELWKSDGTDAGTVMVKDINPGNGDSKASWLIDVEGTLVFTADDGTHGWELWQSDGTGGGTTMVKDFYQGPESSLAGQCMKINDTWLFAANDSIHGWELWSFTGNSTGIKEENGIQIKLYPNPANDYLIIEGVSNSQVSIYNTNGELISKLPAQNNTIETNGLPTGIYFLKIEGVVGYKRFVKL